MKLFVVKSAMFLAALIVVLNIAGRTADHFAPSDPWEEVSRSSLEDLLEESPTLEAVVIGNSHASAIDFDALGMNGAMSLRPGSDLFETERAVAALTPRMPKLETVFLPVSYASFHLDNAAIVDTRIIRVSVYASLPVWSPVPHDMRNLALGKLQAVARVMSVARPDSWRGVLDGILTGSNGLETHAEASSSLPSQDGGLCPSLTPEEIAEQSEGRVSTEVERARQMMAEHEGLVDDSRRALQSAITLLTARGVRVVLFTPPYWRGYTELYLQQAPDLMEEMHRTIKALSAETDFEYYDLSAREDLAGRMDFFKDSDHLNDCGREAFSLDLLAEMNR